MVEQRKVKVVGRDVPAMSARCPKCLGPLTEAPGGDLCCKVCKMDFERDGEGGRLREVELWAAGTYPVGGAPGGGSGGEHRQDKQYPGG